MRFEPTITFWHRAILLLCLLHPRGTASAFVLSSFGYPYRQSSLPAFFSIAPAAVEAHDSTRSVNDPVAAVHEYTQDAIRYRGEPRGLAALEKLGEMCAVRTPYDFNQIGTLKPETVVAPQQGLLPSSVAEAFLEQVREMERNGWLATNPDSVDGLPSLHLNLVSGGKPVAQTDGDDDFHRGLQKLLKTVEPYIYDELLPTVQKAVNDTSVAVADVFLRRYGQDIMETSRSGISAHYDVYSLVTAVIAMDDAAAEGTNGLYTTETCKVNGTSNHASLRRYFPLESGDGVVHTWDVLHGVDITPGVDRTSLIVWFSTEDALNNSSPKQSCSPWLINNPNLEKDDVAQFVLACAKERPSGNESESPTSQLSEAAMHHTDSASATGPSSILHAHDLYLKSAAAGNAFALTRLGHLSQEKALSGERTKQGFAILENLRSQHSAADGFSFGEEVVSEEGAISDVLANRFWLEGALRGNPMAQCSLADEIMEQSVLTNNQDLRVLAAVLFGLAAQQGNELAAESLARVVDFEVKQNSIETQEEFESSLIVKTAQAALS